MNDSNGYAVFFFPPALEALGEAIKPYLQDGPAGPHVPCREVDTAGAFIEMTMEGRTTDGREIFLELMVPNAMVRMIVSARSDDSFGFYDRNRPLPVMLEPGMIPGPVAQPPETSDDPPSSPVVATAPAPTAEPAKDATKPAA